MQDGAIAVPSDKPVKTAAFTCGFGVRSDPVPCRRRDAPGHRSCRLRSAPRSTRLPTAPSLRAGWNNGGYGNLIEVDHGRGIDHPLRPPVGDPGSAGQRITRGQQIGRMGSTGRSTGSHLHYEVRIDGRAVNPIPFMKSTDYLARDAEARRPRFDGRRRPRRTGERQALSLPPAPRPYLADVTEDLT